MSADRSCQAIVDRAAVQRLTDGLPICSTHTGGHCRAWKRLPLEMVREFACYLGDLMHRQVPDDWQWQGRNVRIIDGTMLTMPDTPENQPLVLVMGNSSFQPITMETIKNADKISQSGL